MHSNGRTPLSKHNNSPKGNQATSPWIAYQPQKWEPAVGQERIQSPVYLVLIYQNKSINRRIDWARVWVVTDGAWRSQGRNLKCYLLRSTTPFFECACVCGCGCVCGCVCVCVRKCVWVGFLGFSCWLWSDDFLVLNGNEICLRTDHSGPAVPHVISNFHRIFHFSSCFPPSTQAHFQFSFRLSIFLSFFATANISLFRLPSTLLIFTIPTPFQAISIQNNEYSIFYRIWDMRIFACFFRSIFLFIFVSFFLSL